MSDLRSQTRIDLLRHGQHQLGDVICGVTDPELSDRGWQQLENQCEKLLLDGPQWTICVASPRKRCADFAAEFSSRHSMHLLVEDDFGEVDFGLWEGLTFNEVSSKFPGQWQDWITNPESPAPHGGESYGDFLSRVNSSWDRLTGSHRSKNILLFSHGGVMRAIYSNVFGLEPRSLFRFNVPHGCHSRIVSYHRGGDADWYQLDTHNG